MEKLCICNQVWQIIFFCALLIPSGFFYVKFCKKTEEGNAMSLAIGYSFTFTLAFLLVSTIEVIFFFDHSMKNTLYLGFAGALYFGATFGFSGMFAFEFALRGAIIGTSIGYLTIIAIVQGQAIPLIIGISLFGLSIFCGYLYQKKTVIME